MQLRWYQQEAIDATLAYWRRGGGNPLIVLPTASGKTPTLVGLISYLTEDRPTRVLVLAHRKELIEQSAATMARICPRVSSGIYSASLGRKQVRQVTFAQIQSAYSKPAAFGRIDVVIIDEAHLVPPEGDGQYQRLLKALRSENDELRVLGLSATPYRMGQGLLTWGEDKVFDSIVYSADMLKLIEQGYLCPLVTASQTTQIDTSKVDVQRGEFVAAQLEAVACDEATVQAIADDVAALLRQGRTSAMLFGTGVTHAKMLRNALQMAGHSCEVVSGETDARERARIIERFRRRDLSAIANCDVLTTGFDATVVDVIAVARPTMSAALWVQICGRGMRLDEGKKDCCVLDYGGNIERHGPIDRVQPKAKATKAQEARAVKPCPSCMAEVPLASRVCPECDYEFPLPERKVDTRASTRAVLSDGKAPPPRVERTMVVHDVDYAEHLSMKSGSCTLRVTYHPENGLGVSEWVCLEHETDSFAWRKAAGWWVKAGGQRPAPESIQEALERIGELGRPVEIKTVLEGKFERVESVRWVPREATSDDAPMASEPPPDMVDEMWGADEAPPF